MERKELKRKMVNEVLKCIQKKLYLIAVSVIKWK